MKAYDEKLLRDLGYKADYGHAALGAFFGRPPQDLTWLPPRGLPIVRRTRGRWELAWRGHPRQLREALHLWATGPVRWARTERADGTAYYKLVRCLEPEDVRPQHAKDLAERELVCKGAADILEDALKRAADIIAANP